MTYPLTETALKIKDYKCFGDSFVGFEQIKPVNLLIGRNNSGKSSLIDLVEYACKPKDISSNGHEGRKPIVALRIPLSEQDIARGFSKRTTAGGIPGRTHFEFGSYWIGKQLLLELDTKKDRRTAIEFEKHRSHGDIEVRGRFNSIAKIIENPFEAFSFKRLRSDRDITPEGESDETNITPNGRYITNVVRRFLTLADLPSDLVEEKILRELNTIVAPDLNFSRIGAQQNNTALWEIYLQEDGRARIPLSQSGSGLKTILSVLVFLYLFPYLENRHLKQYIFAFEELENNLHPSLQRKLYGYLEAAAKQQSCTIFLTTHSNVLIDLASQSETAQILHVTRTEGNATVRKVDNYLDYQGTLDDLGAKASDLLQSNGIIWLEGPSDRIYFNHWIRLLCGEDIREGIHYQCAFYGGSLMAHLTSQPPEDTPNRLVEILRINRNNILLMDSDKENAKQTLSETKQRLIDEISGSNGISWVTHGREIENYLPHNSIAKLYKVEEDIAPLGKFERFENYLNNHFEGEGDRFLRSKANFAHKIIKEIALEDLTGDSELIKKLNETIARIKIWNYIT